MMKVLFVTYPKIGLSRGGLELRIAKTAEELGKIGIEVILFDPWKNQIDDIDICHVFGIDGSSLSHVSRANEKGKAVIISPVLNCFLEKPWQLALKVKLSQWIPGMLGTLAQALAMLKASDRILALNQQERSLLIKSFKLEPQRCLIVPNGINKQFASGDPSLFEEKYKVRDFVLEVGAVVRRKNQLTLIKAMKDLPYTLVIVGEAFSEGDEYMDQCRASAGKNVIFTGPLSHDDPLLSSAFAAAKLFVLPSYSEVMPSALYEAAVAGCKLIASQNFPVAEEIAAFVPRVDPDNPRELAKLIKREMTTPCNPRLREIVLNMPLWADVAQMIRGIYEEVMR